MSDWPFKKAGERKDWDFRWKECLKKCEFGCDNLGKYTFFFKDRDTATHFYQLIESIYKKKKTITVNPRIDQTETLYSIRTDLRRWKLPEADKDGFIYAIDSWALGEKEKNPRKWMHAPSAEEILREILDRASPSQNL